MRLADCLYLPKGDFLRRRSGGVKGDRTRHERELEKALPMRTRGHVWELQRNQDESLSGYSDSRFQVGETPDYERVIEQTLAVLRPCCAGPTRARVLTLGEQRENIPIGWKDGPWR